MSIIVLQHEASETAGRLAPILRDHGHVFDVRRLDQAGARGGKGVPPDFDNVDAVISLGGSTNISDNPPWLESELAYLREAHERQLPLIGVCLGHQLIAKALGGEVAPAAAAEWGFCRVVQTVAGNTETILAGIPWGTYQLQMHEQEVTKLPEGAVVLQSSPACKVQAFRVGLRTYGFQYHFEVMRDRLEAAASGRDKLDAASFSANGIAQAELARQVAEHFETFDRVSERLCENLAAYALPLLRKVRGLR